MRLLGIWQRNNTDMATLFLICGMAGAGKTTLARQLETSRQALRLCPDEWIKKIIKDESDKPELDRLRDPVESLQWTTAQTLLGLGVSVILENGFWSREERMSYRSKAKELGAQVELHYLDVSKEELRRRIEARNSNLPEGSFRITKPELESWLASFTPPDSEELKRYDAFEVHR